MGEGSREHLQRRFAERVATLSPTSILDVGCGDGAVAERLRHRTEVAVALDATPERVRAARERGVTAVVAGAERLPFRAGAFDWVLMRHVVHHFGDPGRALAEAARVCRSGLIVAEPWRDLARPEQALARRIDRWMKRQDRRLGHEHRDDLGAEEIEALLAPLGAWRFERETYLRPELQPLAELRELVAARRDGLAQGAPDREEIGDLLLEAESTGCGRTGTVTVVAHRQP